MQRHHLPLKRAYHHLLAQALETMHLGLQQAPAVVAAPALLDAAPQPATEQALSASLRASAPARASFHGWAFLRGGVTTCAPLWAIAAWHALVS